MASIANSRASLFSRFFPNHAEYASKVRPQTVPGRRRKRKKLSIELLKNIDIPPENDQQTVVMSTSEPEDNENPTPVKMMETPKTQTDALKQSSKEVQAVAKIATQGTQTETFRTGEEIPDDPDPIKLKAPDVPKQPIFEEMVQQKTPDLYSKPKLSKQRSPSPPNAGQQPETPKRPQKLDGDPHKRWNDMKAIGEPRIVVSVLGSSDTDLFPYRYKDQKLLKKSLKDVARRTGKCGFIYNETQHLIHKIVKNSCPIEGLSSTMFGFYGVQMISTDPMRFPKNLDSSVQNVRKVQFSSEALFQYNMELLNVERHINNKEKRNFIECTKSTKDMRIPVALFVLNGDLATLEHVVRAIYSDISVVVVKGSGGAADIIAFCLEDMRNLKKLSPTMFTIRMTEALQTKMKKVLSDIKKKEWMVSIFDLTGDSYDVLWEKITDGIIRAWSFENTEVEAEYKKDQIFSQSDYEFISQYLIGSDVNRLTKEELFLGYSMHRNDSTFSNQKNVFVDAFLSQNTAVLSQILSGNNKFTLDANSLKNMYEQKFESMRQTRPNNITICNIIQKVDPKGYALLNGQPTDESIRAAVKSITDELLKGLCFTKIGLVACCRDCKQKNSQKKSDDNRTDSDSLQCAVLTNDKKDSRYFWPRCKNPMMTALISSCYLNSMANVAEEFFEESLHTDLERHSKLFSHRAVQLLDRLFLHNEEMATMALDYVSMTWGHLESPLHFGRQFQMEEFISHAATQKDASKRLYSYIERNNDNSERDYDVKNKYMAEGVEYKESSKNTNPSPQCLTFIKHHFSRRKPVKILTAPITKLVINVMLFITALIMFSIFLTTDLYPRSISTMEWIVFLYMIGDLYEEILSMVRPQDGNWSPQRIFLHIAQIWNIMDFLCFGLYITAFFMHWFGSEDLLVHTRRIYSVALLVMFLRILNVLLMIKSFGIIIIMVKEMLIDLYQYLVILVILLFAAGIAYHANIYPNHSVTAFPRDITHWRIWTILRIPYWQVYGELNLDTLEGSNTNCTYNVNEWRNDPSKERCPEEDWLPPVIAAFYMMLTHWLLLNIVIAMFSARFEAIRQKATQKWRYNRHSVVIDYEYKIPSPFNIPIRFLSLFIYVAAICPCSCCPGNSSESESKDIKKKRNAMLTKQKELAEKIIQEEKTC